jgi:hypothetical protein
LFVVVFGVCWLVIGGWWLVFGCVGTPKMHLTMTPMPEYPAVRGEPAFTPHAWDSAKKIQLKAIAKPQVGVCQKWRSNVPLMLRATLQTLQFCPKLGSSHHGYLHKLR